MLSKEACEPDENCSLDFNPSTIDSGQCERLAEDSASDECGVCSSEAEDEKKSKVKEGYFRNSIESKLLAPNGNGISYVNNDFEVASELDLLLHFCSELRLEMG